MADQPRELEAHEAAEVLRKALRGHKGELTVADAATKAGLSLRAAEKGLFWLLERYPSSLAATSEGELLFRFDNGLARLRKELSPTRLFFKKAGRALSGIGRFVLRAWISVVLIGYAAVFLAVILALTFAKQGDSNDHRGPGLEVGYVLLRLVGEALFWTFHPFSPFAVQYRAGYGRYEERGYGRRQKKKQDVPFYEKVNRFVFGPQEPEPDPREQEQRILAEIRALKGRIGVTDVMRVTGLDREAAEPLLARLMLDYEGEVEVSDEGGITYRFPALRRSAEAGAETRRPRPAWLERLSAGALTGNSAGANVLIAALNGFNLILSLVAMGANLTIDNLQLLLQGVPVELLPSDGMPLALGLIPFLFSLAIFAMPLGRAMTRPAKQRKVARENGRRGLLRVVLDKVGATRSDEGVKLDEETLQRAWAEAAGAPPNEKELVREAVKLGGDVDVDESSGRAYFRFRDLEAEVAALEAERLAADERERLVGEVVYRADEATGRAG